MALEDAAIEFSATNESNDEDAKFAAAAEPGRDEIEVPVRENRSWVIR